MTTPLWKTSEIIGSRVQASDGEIGSVSDLLFDDTHWGLRWGVIDTGGWLPGRRVLLPISEFGGLEGPSPEVSVKATRDQVEASPGIEADAPVSHQLETDIYTHYDWTPYWSGGFAYPLAAGGDYPSAAGVPPHIGALASPPDMAPPRRESQPRESQHDPHLRSIGEVTGYYVEASDGNIGHVEDFVTEKGPWAVRYLMIDTRNWWPGRKVLISPHWAREISWHEQQVFLDVTRDKVKDSPEYTPDMAIGREHESSLHSHYGYPPYWG